MKNSFLFGYSTTKDLEEAKEIANRLVIDKLVACVNILPQMHSIYSWKDELISSTECVLLFKTTSEKVAKLEETLLAIHSYECPCLVFLPIEAGHDKFLNWISSQIS